MSGSGSPVSVLADLLFTTGPAVLTDEEAFVNEVALKTYVAKRFKAGKDMADMLQGGPKIIDDIYFDLASSYKHYNPNEGFDYDLPQFLSQWEAPWQFTSARATWTDHEIGLNMGQLSRKARVHRYKRLYKSKLMNLMTDLSNGMEADYWAQPSPLMEVQGGKYPYSITTFVTEFANALPVGMTTIQNISPVTQPKWRNQQATYVGTQASVAVMATELFRALTLLWRRLNWEQMPHGPEYADRNVMPTFVAASEYGCLLFEDCLREKQDLFLAGRQDPAYPKPLFRGMPVEYIEALDTAKAYSLGGTAFQTEAGATVKGPRFYILNAYYMLSVWHEDRYFYKKEPFSPSRHPYSKVLLVDCWHNNIVRSRRRHGILSPTASNVVVNGVNYF